MKKAAEFEDMVPKAEVHPEEVDEAKKLIETKAAAKLDMATYKDRNTEQLKQFVEAKVAGKEIVASPPAQEHAQVLSLMDALKKSVAEAKGEARPAEADRPPKKVAPSTPPKPAQKRKSL